MGKLLQNKNLIFSLIVSVPLFLYAPFEMFFINYEDFGYGIGSFWIWIVLASIVVSTFLYLLGFLISKVSRKLLLIYYSFLFCIGLLILLQGNLLCTNAGLMTGEPIDWGMHSGHFIKDALIWLFAFIAIVVLGLFCKDKAINIFSLVSKILIATQLISLIILIISAPENSKSSKQSFISDKNLFTVSSNKNVIVFVLDMFDARYFDSILETDYEDIEKILDGFTYYQNFTGTYSTTEYSIPSLLTGQYLMNDCGNNYEEMISNAFNKSNLFKEMEKDQFLFDIYTYKHMIPNQLLQDSTNFIAEDDVVVRLQDVPNFLLKLYRFVLCKYGPDFIKPYIWFYKNEFTSFGYSMAANCKMYSVENLDFLNKLNLSSIVKAENNRFKFIHLDGTHYPYITDENLEEKNMSQDEETACRTALGVIKLVGMYLDKLKESNCFDNSAIILTADHGYYGGGTLCSPIMIVKPLNSKESFKISTAPGSSIDFQATIADMIGYDQVSTIGQSILNIDEDSARERLFYQYYLLEGSENGLRRLIEYTVLPSGRERKDFILTDREISTDGKILKHSTTCEYCLEYGLLPEDAPVTKDITHHKKAS